MVVTMTAFWDNVGTAIPPGDAEYVVSEQPIAEHDNWFNYEIASDMQKVIDDIINRFNANTILKADTDNTPAALVVAEQTIVGRKTGNSIAALTATEVRTILNVEDGATSDQTDSEIRDAVDTAIDSNVFTDADHTKLNGVETGATKYPDTGEQAFLDGDHTKLNGIETGADNTPSASTTVSGKIELATSAEINTGTQTSRANTPDALAGSIFGTKTVVVKCILDTEVLDTGDGKAYVTIPAELNGMNLVSVGAHVYTVSSSGTPTFQIHNLTDTVDMLSTRITIDATEKDSATAATPPVINTSNDDIATGDELRLDCDVTGTGAKGMEIRMGFRLP